MSYKSLLFALFIIIPGLAAAQKAYETVLYEEKRNGTTYRVLLADGYFPASQVVVISARKDIYLPENGTIDDKGQCKFILKGDTTQNHYLTVYFRDLQSKGPPAEVTFMVGSGGSARKIVAKRKG